MVEMGKLLSVGIVFIFIGITFIVISIAANLLSSNKTDKIEIGFGGFIGPIPFGFFTSKKMFWIWLGLLVLGLIFLFLSRKIF